MPFEGATQIGTWELLSSTITLIDNSVYQTSFSNSEEPKTFETIDARPYDNSGMQSIGTNQTLPANVVNFENEYFSKPDGLNFINTWENADEWGNYYSDVKSYWDNHPNSSVNDYFIWEEATLYRVLTAILGMSFGKHMACQTI